MDLHVLQRVLSSIRVYVSYCVSFCDLVVLMSVEERSVSSDKHEDCYFPCFTLLSTCFDFDKTAWGASMIT